MSQFTREMPAVSGRRRSPLRRSIVGLSAIALGGMLGLILPAQGGATGVVLSTNVHLPDPDFSLAQAEKAAPYAIRLPTELPAGTRTVLIDWAIADAAETGSVVNVDAWYETPAGERIHLWQTNSQMLATSGQDPSAPNVGSPLLVEGSLWQENHFDGGSEPWIELGRRFPDGVTVALAGPATLGGPSLRDIAASIE
jgi:hypothetical protein